MFTNKNNIKVKCLIFFFFFNYLCMVVPIYTTVFLLSNELHFKMEWINIYIAWMYIFYFIFVIWVFSSFLLLIKMCLGFFKSLITPSGNWMYVVPCPHTSNNYNYREEFLRGGSKILIRAFEFKISQGLRNH